MKKEFEEQFNPKNINHNKNDSFYHAKLEIIELESNSSIKNNNLDDDMTIEIIDLVNNINLYNDLKTKKQENIKKSKKNKHKKAAWFFTYTFALCFLVCISLIFLNWKKFDKEVETQMEDIFKNVVVNDIEINVIGEENDKKLNDGNVIDVKRDKVPSDYYTYSELSLLSVDFKELLNKNSDTKGWIKVAGTNVNYPFVQANDNKYYLTHSFDKKYNEAGWVFMDYRNHIEDLDRNTVIYAHGRLADTMFGTLNNTIKKEWYENKDNEIIKISTPTKNMLWQVFSVYKIPTESYYITTQFENDASYLQYLNTMKSRSVHDFGKSLSIEDKILTLSTCYNDSEKMVLQAKLIFSEDR